MTVADARLTVLRRPGSCAGCATTVPAGRQAWWAPASRQVICTSCAVPEDTTALSGTAGAGAHAHADQLASGRDARSPFGRLSRLWRDRSEEDRWRWGADGERIAGTTFDRLRADGGVVLHDRAIPRSRANIDHVLIVATGVWVVDSKRYTGRIVADPAANTVRAGTRDISGLIAQLAWQRQRVAELVESAGFAWVPVTGALVFVDADWGLRSKLVQVDGTVVSTPKPFVRHVGSDGPVSAAWAERIGAVIAARFPVYRER